MPGLASTHPLHSLAQPSMEAGQRHGSLTSCILCLYSTSFMTVQTTACREVGSASIAGVMERAVGRVCYSRPHPFAMPLSAPMWCEEKETTLLPDRRGPGRTGSE